MDATLLADSPSVSVDKSTARSRVTNGTVLLEGVDGRSREARRFRDFVDQALRDLKREPIEADVALVRRAAALELIIAQRESLIASGQPVDVKDITVAINAQ